VGSNLVKPGLPMRAPEEMYDYSRLASFKGNSIYSLSTESFTKEYPILDTIGSSCEEVQNRDDPVRVSGRRWNNWGGTQRLHQLREIHGRPYHGRQS
jgi:hypothetical protein